MITATRPPLEVHEIFGNCCDGIEDKARRGRLLFNASKVDLAAADYQAAGEAGIIHLIDATTYEPLGGASTDDFVWLYDKRLVASSIGRVYYDSIRDANRNGRCALCNVNPAWTLDHHLPKAEHPVFAVTPDNLLPACRDCNSNKLQNQTPILNTYFDDLGPGPWLRLEVLPTNPWIPKFSLEIQGNWPAELARRAQEHFNLLKLQRLYAYQANRQVAGIRHRLADLLANQGMAGVRMHLDREAVSWRQGNPNSWEAAMYAGLAESDWFCAGGFDQ